MKRRYPESEWQSWWDEDWSKQRYEAPDIPAEAMAIKIRAYKDMKLPREIRVMHPWNARGDTVTQYAGEAPFKGKGGTQPVVEYLGFRGQRALACYIDIPGTCGHAILPSPGRMDLGTRA